MDDLYDKTKRTLGSARSLLNSAASVSNFLQLYRMYRKIA